MEEEDPASQVQGGSMRSSRWSRLFLASLPPSSRTPPRAGTTLFFSMVVRRSRRTSEWSEVPVIHLLLDPDHCSSPRTLGKRETLQDGLGLGGTWRKRYHVLLPLNTLDSFRSPLTSIVLYEPKNQDTCHSALNHRLRDIATHFQESLQSPH